MVALECPYCDHANPAAAKFCNACGSHLQLKLCSHCQAANDQLVKSCYECGREFPESAESPEAAARAACERLQQLLRSSPRTSAPSTKGVVAATPGEVAAETRPKPIPEPANESRARIQRRENRKSVWKTALLSTTFVSLIGVCAYLVNQHSLQLAELFGVTKWISTAPADPDPAVAATRPIPGTTSGVTPLDRPNAVGKPGIAAIPAPALASQVGAPTDATPAPTGTHDKDIPAPPPAAKRQEPSQAAIDSVVSTGTAASREPLSGSAPVRSQPTLDRAGAPAARATVCTEALSAAGLCNPSASDDRGQAATQSRAGSISPRASPNNQAISTPSGTVQAAAARAPAQSQPAPRANVPRASPSPGVCTEAVAAIGLCSPNSAEGSK